MRSWRFAVVLMACGWACLAVAYLNRDVYPSLTPGLDSDDRFRSGWTAYAAADPSDWPPNRFDILDLSDPLLWTGAGLALMSVAFTVVLMAVLRRRSIAR